MTIKEANKISELINTLLCWSGIAQKMCDTNKIDIAVFDRCVRRYNEAADDLGKMGIAVHKYGTPYLQQKETNDAAA